MTNEEQYMTETQHPGQENIVKITTTVDINGHLLVAGQTYLYKDKPIRILRESYGAGNPRLPYYTIFYTDDTPEEQSLVIDARYPGGMYGGVIYRALFTPV